MPLLLLVSLPNPGVSRAMFVTLHNSAVFAINQVLQFGLRKVGAHFMLPVGAQTLVVSALYFRTERNRNLC